MTSCCHSLTNRFMMVLRFPLADLTDLVSQHRLSVSQCLGTQLNSQDSWERFKLDSSGFHKRPRAHCPTPIEKESGVSCICYTQENSQRFDLHKIRRLLWSTWLLSESKIIWSVEMSGVILSFSSFYIWVWSKDSPYVMFSVIGLDEQ